MIKTSALICRIVLLVAGTMWLSSLCLSQPFVRQVEPFPVQANNVGITLPFAGGVNSPQHHFADIDGDGDLDLFTFDVDQAVNYYRNVGTRFLPRFEQRNELIAFPQFSTYFVLVDYDGDGRIDLCTEDSLFSGLRLYKNTGTLQTPAFTRAIATLHDTSGADVYTGGNSIPTFADIDADGDLDLFSANPTGFVNYYRNVGTRTLPRYAFVTGTWENILILGDTCTSGLAMPSNANHGAAAYSFADYDGDGDYDFFVGDLFWTELFAVRNAGTAQQPQMECFTSHFPPSNAPVTTGFNQTSFVDIDGDGDLDMFVAVLAGIVQKGGFMFYRNLGTPTAQNLRLETQNYLSTIDVGMSAHPTFVDIDNDGDQDMFVGNLGGELSYYRNTGSTTSPLFALVDTAFAKVDNGFYFSPAFVDIDNDGDKDLFAGMYDGRMRYFHNTGTAQTPQFLRTAFVTDTIDVLNTLAPAFVDIDGDADKDLIVGSKNGTFRFYRNTGTVSNFLPTLVTPTFLGISVGLDTYVVPTFSDIDADGDFDFFFGAQDGRLEFYENTGSPANPQYSRRAERYANIAQVHETVPAFADIDGDNDLDLFVGERKGGMHFYKNTRLGTSADEYRLPTATKLLPNFPNPFNPATEIKYRTSEINHVTLQIFNLLGTETATLVNEVKEPGEYAVQWNAEGLASGVYFCRLTTPSTTDTRKLLLIK